MKTRKRYSSKKESQFISDYKDIMEISLNPVIKNTEWVRKGDAFQKFSMYNPNYKIVPSLKSIGYTTLTKVLY